MYRAVPRRVATWTPPTVLDQGPHVPSGTPGEPVVSMALWFVLLSGAATLFCRFAYRRSVAHVPLRERRLTRIPLRCYT